MVAIIDYGVGNLFSLRSSFAAIGEQAEVTGDAARIAQADRVILPGVGAFADAYDKLCESGMDEAVRRAVKSGKPVMGICLGMQLLFCLKKAMSTASTPASACWRARSWAWRAGSPGASPSRT